MKDSKTKNKVIDDKSWDNFLKGVTPLKPRNHIEPELPKRVSFKETSRTLFSPFDFGRKESLSLHKVSRKEMKRVQLEGRLDLHGLIQNQAHETFLKFIENAFSQGKKIILVITGKGALENPQTLNKLLPRWCEEHPFNKMIKSISSAKVEHGGRGAYYVFLRKLK